MPQINNIKRGLSKEIQKKISAIATQANARKIISSVLAPVEVAIHDLAIEVLRGLTSALSGGHDAELERLRIGA